MKIALLVFTLCILLVTACAPEAAPTEDPSSPDEQPPPTKIPVDLTPAQLAAISALSKSLGISPEDIKLVSTEAVDWPDGCLGVQEEGVACAEVITPGFRIMLDVKDREVEYRTNQDGTQVRPATVLMRWKREGGIAGFCDSLTVYLSGEVHRSSCKGDTYTEASVSDILPETELAKLNEWVQEYGSIEIDDSDPKGVSDRMVVNLVFEGLGNRESLSSTGEEELLEFARSLMQSSEIK